MKRLTSCLAAVAAVFLCVGPVGAEIQWAGSQLISLDADELSVGAFASWANAGTAAGTFDPDPTSPYVVTPGDPATTGDITVQAFKKGLNDVYKNVVMFDNLNNLLPDGTIQAGGRRPANGLVWSNPTDALFGGAASDFSVEAWIYDDRFSGIGAFVSLARRDNGGGFMSYWSETLAGVDTNAARLIGSSVNYAKLSSDPRPDPTGGRFYYYAFVYHKDLSTVDVYIDGAFVETIALAPGLAIATGQPVHLGGYGRVNPDNIGGGFTGGIAKLRVHGGALTAPQVLNNFSSEQLDYQFRSSAADIVTFGLPRRPATIAGTDISWSVPFGWNLSALAPTYTVSALATGMPAPGSIRNFAGPVAYTVIAQDGTTKLYTVTVTPDSENEGLLASAYDNTQGTRFLNPISNLMNVWASGASRQVENIDYTDATGFTPFFPGLTNDESFSILWTGWLDVSRDGPGEYTFGTASDDGSVVYVDLNGDGVFDPATELVVDNNRDQGTTEATGTVNLTGSWVQVAIGYYENGGGNTMVARFKKGTGLAFAALDPINGTSGYFFTTPPPAPPTDLVATPGVEQVSLTWVPPVVGPTSTRFPVASLADGFDSYATGSKICGQGGWEGWDDVDNDAIVTDEVPAYSTPNSLRLEEYFDVVQRFAGVNSGVWKLRLMTYVPTGDRIDSTYIILMDTYTVGGDPKHWASQTAFRADGLVHSDYGTGVDLPIQFDKWVEYTVEIDFDQNLTVIEYGGQHLVTYPWKTDGRLELQALDLYSNGAAPMYFDDFSLTPIQHTDNFDVYRTGSKICGQGGWEGWDDVDNDAIVTDEVPAYSAPNSLRLEEYFDVVQRFTGVNSGVWKLRLMTYVPTGDRLDSTYVILMDTYTVGGDPKHWASQTAFRADGFVHSDYGTGVDLPIQFDKWVEYTVEIDFDKNLTVIEYGGQHLVTYPWKTDGLLELQALDLYSNGAAPMYFDDFSLTPVAGIEPTGYQVFREGVKIADVDASTTSYLDASAVPGVENCYTVRSTVLAQAADPSNEACATPSFSPPNPPTGLVATGGVEEVSLVWVAPASGTTPTGYEVFRDGVKIADVPATATSYTDGDGSLVPGTEYCYTVKAVAAGLESDASNESCATPEAAGVGPFVRGDCNGDGNVTGEVTDAVFLLNYNFLGGAAPPCMAACDANGDGHFVGEVTDAVYILSFNFLGGPAPLEPFPKCARSTLDTDKDLGCATATANCPP